MSIEPEKSIEPASGFIPDLMGSKISDGVGKHRQGTREKLESLILSLLEKMGGYTPDQPAAVTIEKKTPDVSTTTTQTDQPAPAVSRKPEMVNSFQKNQMLYRRWREKAPIPDEVGRIAAGTVAASAPTYSLVGMEFMQNALLMESVVANSFLSSLPGVPFATLLARRMYAKWLHEKEVQNLFTEAVRSIVESRGGEKTDAAMLKRLVQEAQEKIVDYADDSDVELINTDDEQLLLQAFHNAETARPATTPYLGTTERYARYCFAKLKELCERSVRQSIPGLHKNEMKILKKHCLSTCPDIVDAHERENREEHLYQASVAYGRMLCNYHREKREGQVTGSTFGTALTASYLTGNIAPLLVGGGLWGLRKIYRKAQTAPQHLEIAPSGRLQGKGNTEIISVEAAKSTGGSLFRPDILDHYKEESQLSDKEKRWLPLIQLPQKIVTKRHKTVESLAYACAPAVQTILGQLPPFPKDIEPEEKEDAKKRFEKEDGRLEALERESKDLKRDVSTLEDETKEAEELGKGTGGGERGDLARDQAQAKVKAIDKKIEKKNKRIVELEEDDGEIAKQKLSLKEARDAYDALKKPEKPTQPMTAKAVGENMEIAHAFSVKVHQYYKIQQERKSGIGKFMHAIDADELPKIAVKETSKFAGAMGLGSLVGTGISAAISYVPIISILNPGYQYSAIAGGLIGTGYYLWKKISK